MATGEATYSRRLRTRENFWWYLQHGALRLHLEYLYEGRTRREGLQLSLPGPQVSSAVIVSESFWASRTVHPPCKHIRIKLNCCKLPPHAINTSSEIVIPSNVNDVQLILACRCRLPKELATFAIRTMTERYQPHWSLALHLQYTYPGRLPTRVLNLVIVAHLEAFYG